MRLLLTLVAALPLCGCANSSTTEKHTIAVTSANGAIEGRPTLGMPIGIPGQTTCIVPFSVETEKGWFESNDPFSKGGYTSQRVASDAPATVYAMRSAGSFIRWHNALLVDTKNGEQWPVLNRRGVISSYQFLGELTDDRKQFIMDAVFFLAVTDDTNKDGSLNDKDAGTVILTSADGRDPRAVSPPGAQVWSTSYDPQTKRLFLLVVADTNHDGVFDTKDEPVPYMVDVTRREQAVRVVSEASLKSLEGLLK